MLSKTGQSQKDKCYIFSHTQNEVFFVCDSVYVLMCLCTCVHNVCMYDKKWDNEGQRRDRRMCGRDSNRICEARKQKGNYFDGRKPVGK